MHKKKFGNFRIRLLDFLNLKLLFNLTNFNCKHCKSLILTQLIIDVIIYNFLMKTLLSILSITPCPLIQPQTF